MASSSNIKAAVIIGSQARKEFVADEYSDLDIIIISTNPEIYLASDDWLKSISEFNISFIEDTLFGAKERRVLFEDGTDVDFIVLSLEQSTTIKSNQSHCVIFERGFAVIKDEIAISDTLNSFQNLTNFTNNPKLLSETEFNNAVNDFWFHSVWASKKIMRGELMTAKSCLDSYMKRIIFSFIENYAILKNNSCDIWYNGRFIENWADNWVIEKLSNCYAKYNKIDMIEAIYATMELFGLIAVNISEQLSFLYPKESENQAYRIINSLFAK